MEDTSKTFCRIVFDVLYNHGMRNVVCSPGSRNLPLLAAAASRPGIKKYFVTDERSAAFVGLGLSTVKQEPVGLICTSGSALLNYAPAIAEAYYQGLPLIVISADRPLQWIDQDDSQTIRQDGVLNNYVKKSYSVSNLGEDSEEMQWYVNRMVNDAILTACSSKPGPVHINVHLSEPLGLMQTTTTVTPRIITEMQADAFGNKEIIKELARKLGMSKVLLVAGFSLPDSYNQRTIAEFCKFPNVAVMAETISNLHLPLEDYIIDSVLTVYSESELDKISPDIIISFGGALVSRKLKEYLRRNSDRCEHWSIGYTETTVDPFMCLSLKIETEISRFFKNLTSALKKFKITEDVSFYKTDWNLKKKEAFKVKSEFIRHTEWSELRAFEIILHNIPRDYNLFLSNGTPIRYAQIINYPLPHASYCNRGVSGIDGCTSSAIGGALAYKGKTLLISGDLSMSYDIGALSLKETPDNFKIIVIDNQGGGIFRFVPSTSGWEEREKYLCQNPELPVKKLSVAYGWKYFECKNETELKKVLSVFFKENKKSILKVICPGIKSSEILKEYMDVKSPLPN